MCSLKISQKPRIKAIKIPKIFSENFLKLRIVKIMSEKIIKHTKVQEKFSHEIIPRKKEKHKNK